LSSRHQKRKTPKEEQAPGELLGLLVVIASFLLIIIIIIPSRSTGGTNAKGRQLSKSQRGIGVGDGWEDRHVRELLEWLILLTLNGLLVVANNLHALLNDIQLLIGVVTHGEDTLEHLQHPKALRGGRGGTTDTGGA
jgi:hypothetical protein